MRRFTVVVIIGLLFLGVGSTAAVAASGNAETDVKEIGSQDISISDTTLTVSDVHVSGSDLPSKSIDEKRYTIDDASFTLRGLTVTYQDQTYEICRITLTIDDVGIVLENISIGE